MVNKNNILSAWYNGRTPRCGRDDPGSIPGADFLGYGKLDIASLLN